MIISDFVKCELDKFRIECNFTEEELDFFNYCKIKEMAAEKLY